MVASALTATQVTTTVTDKDLPGINRTHRVTMTVTPVDTLQEQYPAGGIPISVEKLALARLKVLFSDRPILSVTTGASAGTATPHYAEWDGSTTAPKIILYDQAFVELVDTTRIAAAFSLKLIARGR